MRVSISWHSSLRQCVVVSNVYPGPFHYTLFFINVMIWTLLRSASALNRHCRWAIQVCLLCHGAPSEAVLGNHVSTQAGGLALTLVTHYSSAARSVITLDGVPVAVLFVARVEAPIPLDISLLNLQRILGVCGIIGGGPGTCHGNHHSSKNKKGLGVWQTTTSYFCSLRDRSHYIMKQLIRTATRERHYTVTELTPHARS